MATQYATIADLKQLALTARAVEGVLDADINAALLAASSVADTYLAARYADALPLTTWPSALRQNVCKIAAWNLMCAIGFNPNDGAHVALQLNHDAALRWFRDLAAGKVTLAIAETSPRHGLTPTVHSDDSRGL